MTTVKDTYDVWSEGAFEYVRDQLRSNIVVGLKASGEATKQVEIGDVTLIDVASHPHGAPVIWLTPMRDRIQRMGGNLSHRIRVEVSTYMVAPLQPMMALADLQKRHRQYAGRVYNEVLELRDTGITAGHWHDWEPDGDLVYTFIGLEDRAILRAMVPFVLTHDRLWINQGV